MLNLKNFKVNTYNLYLFYFFSFNLIFLTRMVFIYFFPETGDICDWNNYYWEINGVTEPQLIGGSPSFSHAIKATAHRSRLSSLQIEERPR